MPITNGLWRIAVPAIVLVAFALAAPSPSAAQAAGGQPPTSAQDLSQSQLESFVAAATRVGEITERLQAEAQGVASQDELAARQQQANVEMVAAVEAEGLTVEEYNMIFQVAQVDPELNATLMEMLQR